MDHEYLIIVRGGGDLATGTIHRLWRAGFPVLVLETERPAAIRRTVAVSEAVWQGSAKVEDMEAVRITAPADRAGLMELLREMRGRGQVPVLADPEGSCIGKYRPEALVDAIIAKKNLGTSREMAPLTIALGPGFTAGKDVDYVIETKRGHDLGRVIAAGSAAPNTGIPGIIGGYGKERVIHAECAGILRGVRSIGDRVRKGETIAMIGDRPVEASLDGVLRGLIRDGYSVPEGFKIADIDPRPDAVLYCGSISDKSRCIAGSVLEVVCRHLDKMSRD